MSGLTNVDNWILGLTAVSLFGTWLFTRSQAKRRKANRGVVYKNMSTIEQSQKDKIREANRLLNQIDSLNANLKTVSDDRTYYLSATGHTANVAELNAYYTYNAFVGFYCKGSTIRRVIQEELVELEAQLSKLELKLS